MRVRGELHRGHRQLNRVAGESVTDRMNDMVRSQGEHASALRAILPHILRLFRREPALALTVCYVFVALAGIYYDHGFYQRGFGIPVLTLSQVGDFLVAGLQQPMALVLLVSTLPLCWLFDWLNARARRQRMRRVAKLEALPERSRWQSRRLAYLRWRNGALWLIQLTYVVVIVGYGWIFVGTYAQYRSELARRGDLPRVAIRMTGQPTGLQAVDPKGWGYLGAVSNYVFVYDPAAKRALVLPVNAIEQIQPAGLPAESNPLLPVVRLH